MSRLMLYVIGSAVAATATVAGAVALFFSPAVALPSALFLVPAAGLVAGVLAAGGVALAHALKGKGFPLSGKPSRILWPLTTTAAVLVLLGSFYAVPRVLAAGVARSLMQRHDTKALSRLNGVEVSSPQRLQWLEERLLEAERVLTGDGDPLGVVPTVGTLRLDGFAERVDDSLLARSFPEPGTVAGTISVRHSPEEAEEASAALKRVQDVARRIKSGADDGKSKLVQRWANYLAETAQSIRLVAITSESMKQLQDRLAELEKKQREGGGPGSNGANGTNGQSPGGGDSQSGSQEPDWDRILVLYCQVVREVKQPDDLIVLHTYTADIARRLNGEAELMSKKGKFDTLVPVLEKYQREIGRVDLMPATDNGEVRELWEGQRTWLLKVIDLILNAKGPVNLGLPERPDKSKGDNGWTWPGVRERILRAYPIEQFGQEKITAGGKETEFLKYVEDQWQLTFVLPRPPHGRPLCNPYDQVEEEAIQRATVPIIEAMCLWLPKLRREMQARHDTAAGGVNRMRAGPMAGGGVPYDDLMNVNAPFSRHPQWKPRIDSDLVPLLGLVKFEPRYVNTPPDADVTKLIPATEENLLMAQKYLGAMDTIINTPKVGDESLAHAGVWYSVFHTGDGSGGPNPFSMFQQARRGVPKDPTDPKSEPIGGLPPMDRQKYREMQNAKEPLIKKSVPVKPVPTAEETATKKKVQELREEISKEAPGGRTPTEERDAAVKKYVRKKVPDEKKAKEVEEAVLKKLKLEGAHAATPEQAVEQAIEAVDSFKIPGSPTSPGGRDD